MAGGAPRAVRAALSAAPLFPRRRGPMMRMMPRVSSLVLCATLAFATALPAAAGEVILLHLEDTIQPVSQRYIERGLAEAARRDAVLLVLQLDTPGGLIDSTRKITSAITGSPVPVAVFVAPGGARAASAGFFILISADVAAMAPGTNTGASSPVGGKGEDIGETLKKKVFNDTSAMVRSLAEARGRNVDKAIEAVMEASSFTAKEALEDGLIDLIAKDLDDLLHQLDGREIKRFDGRTVRLELADAVVIPLERTPAESFLSVLANPNVAYLLMALGMLGIYVEVTHPGGVLPGVVGVIAMLLALYSLSVLPVNLAGVALIVFALVLFLLEVKITSYGLLTAGGVISFVLGSLILFDSPIPDMRVSLGVVLPTALAVAGITIFLLTRVARAHRAQVMTGKEGLIGEVGQVLVELAPQGKIAVHGEYWDARTEAAAPLPRGTLVRVVAVGGHDLLVEPADGSNAGR